MAIYRVKQFIWATKSLVEKVDTDYVDKFLNRNEKILFNKLKKSDKHHSIRVCKDAIEILKNKNEDIEVSRVAKAALLHDIGKTEYGLNIFEKSALVILNKVTNGKIKKYKNIKQVDIYYNHPYKGVDLLKEFNDYDKEFLESVKYHHNNEQKTNNKLLNIIKESDNKN